MTTFSVVDSSSSITPLFTALTPSCVTSVTTVHGCVLSLSGSISSRFRAGPSAFSFVNVATATSESFQSSYTATALTVVVW